MVLDTSAILAVFFNEPKGAAIAKLMEENFSNLRMSTVNLTETLILLKDRQPQLFDQLKSQLMGSNIRFVAPDPQHAAVAADARIRLPLNLGDCFAYALAKIEDCPLLTLDKDFKKVDIKLVEI